VEIEILNWTGLEGTAVAGRELEHIVRRGLDELERLRLPNGREPVEARAVVARWQPSAQRPLEWRTAFFEEHYTTGDAVDRRRSLEGAIVHWALGGVEVDKHHQLKLRFILQERIDTTADDDSVKGWLWLDSADGLYAGVVQKGQGVSHHSWSSFREWSKTQPKLAQELIDWLRAIHNVHPEVSKFRLCFSTQTGTAYALSLHSQPVTVENRRRHAVEALKRGDLSMDAALLSLRMTDLDRRVHLSVEQRSELTLLAHGQKGENVLVHGRAAFTAEGARILRQTGDPVILLCESFEPRDIAVLGDLAGIVSLRGGPASHAIVVARGSDVATLLGAEGLQVDSALGRAVGRDSATVKEGEWLVLDEAEGALYAGRIRENEVRGTADEPDIRDWAMMRAGSTVWANADNAEDVRQALSMRAGGIGLCRSENHLLEPRALRAFQRYLLSGTDEVGEDFPIVVASLREALLNVLRAADGRWVHYRLLDPRFDELLPEPQTSMAKELATELGELTDVIDERLRSLHRAGGMLGERGCRWGLRSGFYKDQLMAVSAAIRTAVSENGTLVRLALVVPLVVDIGELTQVRELADCCLNIPCERVELKFGCMVETARAAILSSELARKADVLCFGTNDLTQSFWGLSRNEASDVLSYYERTAIIAENPFRVIDRKGLGRILEAAFAEIARTSPRTEIVVCGEQAADPESAVYLLEAGAGAVSCRKSSMAEVALAVSQQKIRQEGHSGSINSLSDSRTEVLCAEACSGIRRGLVAGRPQSCHVAAQSWASVVSKLEGLGAPKNWKFFKRDLAAKWFGSREHARLDAGWTTDEVLASARKFESNSRTVRCSVFPDTIACHSVSKALPTDGDEDLWREIIDSLDKSAPIEVFPQQALNQLCFRAVISHGRTVVEAGIGQAMYVFEEERGFHPVAIADLDWIGSSSPRGPDGAPLGELSTLLEHWGEWLLVRLIAASTTLGTQWLGVEGYYNPYGEDCAPFVCDMDLPLDMAFHFVEPV